MTSLILALVLMIAAFAVVLKQKNERKNALKAIDEMSKTLELDETIESETIQEASRRLTRSAHRIRETNLNLNKLQSQLTSSLDSLNYGIAIYGKNDQLVFQNPYASSFLSGIHSGALIADAIDQMFESRQGQEIVDQELDIYESSHPASDVRSRKKTFYLLLRKLTLDNHEIGSVVTIEDISEQERLEAVRRDFISNISHEIKTPIGAISLLTETLIENPDIELVQKFAPNILEETDRLSETIDDLLALSQIEHGSRDSFEELDLIQCLVQAQERVRTFAQQNKITIHATMPSKPLVIHGDHLQLTSAFYNLLENGVKYSKAHEGKIQIEVSEHNSSIEVLIRDNGIGIPTKDLDRIFERFYCVDKSHSGRGVGLCLAIVRHVVVNHEGAIRVESTEGAGSTFLIQFPTNTESSEKNINLDSLSLVGENEVTLS